MSIELTPAAGTIPLAPEFTTQVCFEGLDAIATIYDVLSGRVVGNENGPLTATEYKVSTPSADSRSATPSAPVHIPWTTPPTVTAGFKSRGLGNPHAAATINTNNR